jgi:hypothetical protein
MVRVFKDCEVLRNLRVFHDPQLENTLQGFYSFELPGNNDPMPHAERPWPNRIVVPLKVGMSISAKSSTSAPMAAAKYSAGDGTLRVCEFLT